MICWDLNAPHKNIVCVYNLGQWFAPGYYTQCGTSEVIFQISGPVFCLVECVWLYHITRPPGAKHLRSDLIMVGHNSDNNRLLTSVAFLLIKYCTAFKEQTDTRWLPITTVLFLHWGWGWVIEAWHLEYKLGSDIYGFERGAVTYCHNWVGLMYVTDHTVNNNKLST